jgi:hypothetical protein
MATQGPAMVGVDCGCKNIKKTMEIIHNKKNYTLFLNFNNNSILLLKLKDLKNRSQ